MHHQEFPLNRNMSSSTLIEKASQLCVCVDLGRYSRLYHACKGDRGLTFFFFFMAYSVHCSFCLWASLAPPGLLGADHAFCGILCAPSFPPPCPRWLYGYKPLARDHPPLPLSHSPSTGGTCSGRRLIRVRKTAFPTSMFAAPCSKCTHRMDSSGLCTCWECSAGSLRPCSAGTFAPSVKSSNRALRCTFKRENRLRVKSVSGLTLRLSHAQVRDAFVVPHVPRLGALGRVRARRGAQSWTGRHAVAGSRRHCKRCVMRLAAKRSRRSQGRSWVFVTHR